MPIPGLPFTDEQLWDAINGALPAWGLLLLAPRWRLTMPIVTLTAGFFSALYAATLYGSTQGATAALVAVLDLGRREHGSGVLPGGAVPARTRAAPPSDLARPARPPSLAAFLCRPRHGRRVDRRHV